MTTTCADLARHFRFIIGTAAAVLVTSLVFAPAAQAADNWSGIWITHHEFSDPRMKLDLDPQKGPDELDGKYTNTDGSKGKLNGEVVKRSGEEIWTGTFNDNEGPGKGKFRIVLQSDKVTFVGWFKVCAGGECGEKHTWTGEHA